jgi:hypothetical protein
MDEERKAALAAAVARKPAEHDINAIVPIFLPFKTLEEGWLGPIFQLGDLPFALGWTILTELRTQVYVSFEIAGYWDGIGLDWQDQAMRNLERIAEAERYSGHRNDENGKRVIEVMLNKDAIGPSRLLLPHLFDEIFGEHYLVAIPEQTCGVAYRKGLAGNYKADAEGFVQACFEKGTVPMSPEHFDPRLFWGLPYASTNNYLNNESVRRNLKEHGDNGKLPRPIMYTAFFSEHEAFKSYRAFVISQGYTIEQEEFDVGDEGLTILIFSKVQSPIAIDKETAILDDYARKVGAQYDGWLTQAIRP